MYQFVNHSQVLKAIVEFCIGHVNGELAQWLWVLGVKVEPHLAEPHEVLGVVDIVLHQSTGHIPLVNELCDLNYTNIFTAMFLIDKLGFYIIFNR